MEDREMADVPDEYELSPAVPGELPTPTFWPIVLSLGIIFFFWGFLTSIFIWAVGAILMGIGIRGWMGEFKDE